VASGSVTSNEVVFSPPETYNARISYGAPKSYFLVVDTKPAGSGNTFRVGYDPDGYGNPYNYMNQNTSAVAAIEPTATIRESGWTYTKPIGIIPEVSGQFVAAVAVLVPLVSLMLRKRDRSVRRP
jgi:hypothetical protein